MWESLPISYEPKKPKTWPDRHIDPIRSDISLETVATPHLSLSSSLSCCVWYTHRRENISLCFCVFELRLGFHRRPNSLSYISSRNPSSPDCVLSWIPPVLAASMSLKFTEATAVTFISFYFFFIFIFLCFEFSCFFNNFFDVWVGFPWFSRWVFLWGSPVLG